MSCNFTVEIAGHLIQMAIDNGFENEIAGVYGLFFSKGNPLAHLDIHLNEQANLPFQKVEFSYNGNELSISDGYSQGRFNLIDNTGELILSKGKFMFSLGTYLRNIITLMVVRENKGLVLHAAGIVRDNKAFVFIGPSGAGKSTVSRLSTGKIVLSDELVVLKKVNREYKAFPTPNWDDRQSSVCQNKPYKLAGIYKLVKDKTVFVDKLPQSIALADIFTLPYMPVEFIPKEQLAGTFEDLIKNVPYYALHFLPDASFWSCI